MAASIDKFWPNKVFDPRRSPRYARRVHPEVQERVKLNQKLLRQSFSSRKNPQVSVSYYPNAWRNQVGFSESDAGREYRGGERRRQ